MLSNTLLTPSKELGPDARYCLARFVLRFGLGESGGISVKAMAKDFGVSSAVLSASLRALVIAEALVCRSSLTRERGPARSFYRAPKSWCTGETVCSHSDTIAELLQGSASTKLVTGNYSEGEGVAGLLEDLRARRRSQSDMPSNVNRLLLAVLLCHADSFGVVRSIGMAELSKLTGLSNERVGNRIKTLLSLGLIRAYVPGATSSTLFGPTSSIYFLNLNHKALAAFRQVVTAFVLPYPWSGELVEGEAAIWFGRPWSVDDVFQQYFFTDKHWRAVSRVFQARIDEYASYFLSTHWFSLNEIPHEMCVELVSRIQDDFQGPEFVSQHEARAAHETADLKRLFNTVYALALQKARRVKAEMLRVIGPDFETMNHLIMPSPMVLGGHQPLYPVISVLSAPRDPYIECECRVVDLRLSSTESFLDEQDIPLEDRYFYGLLTPAEGQLTVLDDGRVVRKL